MVYAILTGEVRKLNPAVVRQGAERGVQDLSGCPFGAFKHTVYAVAVQRGGCDPILWTCVSRLISRKRVLGDERLQEPVAVGLEAHDRE